MNAVIGWVEWIIRMGGELYHGEIGDVYEMFAVVVALIYREALFNRADVIVLCAPYLGLEGTVAEVAHNHAVFAVLLEARARLHARDSVYIRSGLRGLKNARLLKQAGAEVIVAVFIRMDSCRKFQIRHQSHAKVICHAFLRPLLGS